MPSRVTFAMNHRMRGRRNYPTDCGFFEGIEFVCETYWERICGRRAQSVRVQFFGRIE
jgi:hypothetical protein